MRFRNHERPNRASVRSLNDRAMEPTDAEVFRSTLPGRQSFESGVSVGDPFTPPAQVTGVAASAGLRTLLVEWDRLEDFQTVDGAGGYEVQLDTVATFDSGSERTQRTSATLASFTDLATNTTYYVRVRAVQGADNYGEWSVEASDTTPLLPTAEVVGLDATLSALDADLTAAEADIATLQADLNTAEGDIDTALLQAVEPVSSLPSLPHASYPEGKVVYLTTDDKLYRSDGSSWSSSVSAIDIAGQITETQISDDAVTTPKLVAGAVTTAKIAADAVTANEIAAGTVTAAEIAADTITGNEIAAGAIATNELAANAVTANEIAANAVVAGKIQAGAVNTDKLSADAVTAAKLASITMEVGKHIQSDNYDGTDVETGDATQGFRVQANGKAEFQDVLVRGTVAGSVITTDSGSGPYIEIDAPVAPDTISFYSGNPSETVPGQLQVTAQAVSLYGPDIGSGRAGLWLNGDTATIESGNLDVDDEDGTVAHTVRVGTLAPASVVGTSTPSPGNKLQFDAIAVVEGFYFAQNSWTIDADNGMSSLGDGTTLAFTADRWLGDYIDPPFNDTRTVMELGLNSDGSASIEMDGDEVLDWTSYTPTVSGLNNSGTRAEMHARYRKMGRTVDLHVYVKVGSTATHSGAWAFSLPFPAEVGGTYLESKDIGSGVAVNVGGGGDCAVVALPTNDGLDAYCWRVTDLAAVSGTVPFTWSGDDWLSFNLTYRTAS